MKRLSFRSAHRVGAPLSPRVRIKDKCEGNINLLSINENKRQKITTQDIEWVAPAVGPDERRFGANAMTVVNTPNVAGKAILCAPLTILAVE